MELIGTVVEMWRAGWTAHSVSNLGDLLVVAWAAFWMGVTVFRRGAQSS